MWGAYWRLQHILRSGALGLSMRTAIWRICVFSVLRYSLCHVGIPTGGHNLIRQAVHRQLRLIAKSPAHLWHVTSAQILERLHVEDPWATLCREAQTRSPRPALLLQLPGVLSRLDILQNQFQHPVPQPVPGDVSTTTPAVASSRSEDRSAHAERTVRCPHCQQSFTSLAAMRVHATVQHNRHETSHSELEPTSVSPTVEITGQHVTLLPTSPQQLLPTPLDNSDHHMRRCVQAFADADFLHTGLPADLLPADPQTRFAWLHGTNGLCICRHCNRRCQTWDDLKVHIFTRSCVMLFPDAMNPSLTHLPVVNRLPLLWQLVATDLSHLSWESIARVVQPQILDMKKRCPICDQWLIQSRGLGHHVKAFHPWAHPALQHAYLLMQTSRRGLALSTPCRYCRTSFTGHEAKHAGECSAILLSRFLSILLLPGAQDHEHGLRGTIEGGDPGSRGRAHIPSDLSSERSSLWRYFQPASGRCPPDTSDRPVSQPAKHAFQQLLRNHSGTHSYPRPSAGDTQQVSEASPLSVQGQGKGMGAREAAPSTQEDQSQEQSNRAKRRQQQQLKTRGQHGAPAQSSGTSSSTDTLVQQMAALLLRHEDQFGVLAQSTAWVMFMGTAPPLSVVAPMAAVAAPEGGVREPCEWTANQVRCSRELA